MVTFTTKKKIAANFTKFIRHKTDIELKEAEIFGKNRDIFCYQFTEKDEHGLFSLKLCFYGGIDIYIAFRPEDVQVPANLTTELMNRGIKTFINVQGKLYEFN